jgi:hypothetical protein
MSSIVYDYPKVFSDDSELKNFYLENGYVSIKNGIPREDIDQIVSDINYILSPYASDKFSPIDSAIIHLDKNDKEKLYQLNMALAKLSSLAKIASVLSGYINTITGKKVPQTIVSNGLLLGIPKDDRLVYDYHQESNYMRGFENIFNVHYPLLRSSNYENGTMSVLPKSHKLGTLDFQKSSTTEANNAKTNLIPVDIEKIQKNHEEIFNYLEIGDVVIFHKDLIHKSNYNASDKTRLIGTIRVTTSYLTNWKELSSKEL